MTLKHKITLIILGLILAGCGGQTIDGQLPDGSGTIDPAKYPASGARVR